jgi:hypothetical protein
MMFCLEWSKTPILSTFLFCLSHGPCGNSRLLAREFIYQGMHRIFILHLDIISGPVIIVTLIVFGVFWASLSYFAALSGINLVDS